MSYLKGPIKFLGVLLTLKDGSEQLVKPAQNIKEIVEEYLNDDPSSSYNCSGFTGVQYIPFDSILQDMLAYAKQQAEEEKKYFIPTSNDFVAYYECQVLGIGGGWGDHILGPQSSFINYLVQNRLRTPYLTKEQIEKEGWRFVFKGQWDTFNIYKKDRHSLYHYQNKSISILVDNGATKYSGSCPSINEFRTIMKLLNIK